MNFKVLEEISEIFFDKNKVNRTPKKIEDIKKAFEELNKAALKGEFNALYICDYLHYHIAHESVQKRKVTARDFEDFMAIFLKGEVKDEESRKNDPSCAKSIKEEFVKDYVISNRREKVDVSFDNFGISVKTSVKKNNEINMGSFAREALFFGINKDYGGERKSGLGSAKQLKEGVFKSIIKEGKWELFSQRFEQMIKSIFVDDHVFVIKGGSYLSIYFTKARDFQNLLIDALKKGPDDAIKVINRYEGNSIRIKREPFLEISSLVKIDFSVLNMEKVDVLKKFIQNTEIGVVNYFNKKIKFEELNRLIEKELEEINKK